MYYLGIDLGTSAVKLLLTTEDGTIERIVSKSYPIFYPHPGWSEQHPEDWWQAVVSGVDEILDGLDAKQLRGIGCGGQMHGLVMLDEDDKVIRPAILWNDGRTQPQTDYLNTVIGKSVLSAETANIAFAGFTAPKILWVKENEPENFARIRKIMLPKDYITYRLTGAFATDFSDASGMLLLDVKNRKWSPRMLDICGITDKMLPSLHESWEVVGTLKEDLARRWSASTCVAVVAGAGDNAAAAVGTGTVRDGDCNLSLGTSGTLFIACDKFTQDEKNALHAFAHASGHYHLMACMLSAASCNKWLLEDIFGTTDYAAEQAAISQEQLGRSHVFFLPYLMGERSPLNDSRARAAFIGMTMDTSREDLVQAVLEGVAFALRDSLEIARGQGLEVKRSKLSGGGAKSPLWQKILANVLKLELAVPEVEQGPGYGGAMLAMVGTGAYASVEEVCQALVKTKAVIQPDPEGMQRYEERYHIFQKLYPALKDVFPYMADK